MPGALARATAALFSDYGVMWAATLLGVVVYVTVARSWAGGAVSILAATTAYLVVYVSLTWLRFRRAPATSFPSWAVRQVRPAHVSRLRFWLLGRGSADSMWVALTASAIGMFSAAVGVALADDIAPEGTAAFVALAAVTVAWCWLGVNVAYAVHYAQVFYRDAEGGQASSFPGPASRRTPTSAISRCPSAPPWARPTWSSPRRRCADGCPGT